MTDLFDLSALRYFPLSGKVPRCKWRDVAVPGTQFDFGCNPGYGMICDDPIAVVDFDDDKSRAEMTDGCLAHWCQADGLTVDDLVAKCPVVKTPHGYHLIVAAEDGLQQGQGFSTADGQQTFVDIRANGRGYVVGPGAVIKADGKGAEPAGTPLHYQPLFQGTRVPLVRLSEVLPTLAGILTAHQPALTPRSHGPRPLAPTTLRPNLVQVVGATNRQTTAPTAAPTTAPTNRPSGTRSTYNGRTNWCPGSWAEALDALRNAAPGTSHNVLCGVARFAWRYRNHGTYDARLAAIRDAAAARNIPAVDVENAFRDFIETHRSNDAVVDNWQPLAVVQAPTPPAPVTAQPTATPATVPPAKSTSGGSLEGYIMTDKGAIRECEKNIRQAMVNGHIRIDDMVVDARGNLVHLPTRAAARANGWSGDTVATISRATVVDRIDQFLGGSTKTRNLWLPVVIEEIAKSRTEPMAPDFLAAIATEGQTATIDQLVDHMNLDGDRVTNVRWVEACLLQSLRRILRHASPLENILVLWGGQRTHKTTFIPALFDPTYLSPKTGEYADEWSYTDTLACDLKDEQTVGQRVRGKFCLEVPEMTAFRRTKDIGMIRDVITRTHDSYRAPYAKAPVKQARTCTFVGTANEVPRFGDQYGTRRFCPLHVIAPIDTTWIVEHRTEIWRGLYQTLQANPERVVLTDAEQAAKEQALEPNTYSAIPFFAEIVDALRALSGSSSREVISLTQVMAELTTEQGGPRLQNSELLRTAVEDVLRHLGASRRAGRYPSFSWGQPQREKLEAWVDDRPLPEPVDARDQTIADQAAQIAKQAADLQAANDRIAALEQQLAAARAEAEALRVRVQMAQTAPLTQLTRTAPTPAPTPRKRVQPPPLPATVSKMETVAADVEIEAPTLAQNPQATEFGLLEWWRRCETVGQLQPPYPIGGPSICRVWSKVIDRIDRMLTILTNTTGLAGVVAAMRAGLMMLKIEAEGMPE